MIHALTRLGLAGLLLVASACSDSASPAPAATPAEPAATNDVRIASVVFARELDDQWQPVGGPVSEFRADEHTVYARVTIDGRPRAGTIKMKWMWRELDIAEADIDLSDLNGGLLFSFGEDTFIKGFMNTPQLYIGGGHRLVLLNGDTELGTFPFRVVPPEGARASRFIAGNIYRTFSPQTGPSDASTTFAPGETVYIVGQVALGHASWLSATFTVNGQPMPAITREAIGPEGGGDDGNFAFQAIPEGGWPPGQHQIQLTLDDNQVATYEFSVPANIGAGS